MRPHFIIIWRLCSLLFEETVSCRSVPARHNLLERRLNILVAGGNFFNDTSFSELAEVELIDPTGDNSKCQQPKSLPSKLDGSIASIVNGNSVICGGLKTGYTKENLFAQTVERVCYHFHNDEWETFSTGLYCPRWGASSVMLNSVQSWVIGGNPGNNLSSEECSDTATSSEILKTEHGSFELSVPLPEKMIYHCTVRIDDSRVFIVNGYDENYEGISNAYIVDTSSSPFTFTEMSSLTHARSQAACGIISYQNSLAIVVAGGGFGHTTQTTEVYRISNGDDASNTWEPGPALPRGFSNGCHINDGINNLALIGGFDEVGNVRDDMLGYNPSSEQFEVLPGRLRTPRYGCTAVQLDYNTSCVKR